MIKWSGTGIIQRICDHFCFQLFRLFIFPYTIIEILNSIACKTPVFGGIQEHAMEVRMRHLSLFLFAVILSITGFANGTVRRIQGETVSRLPHPVTAQQFLHRNAARFGWDAAQLHAIGQLPLKHRNIVVIGQKVGEFPVYGRTLKVELDPQGRVTHMFGEPVRNLTVPAGTRVAPEYAVLAAENALDILLPLDMELSLVLLAHQPARLAYLVPAWRHMKKYHVLVDAFTAEVILVDRMWFNTQGRVYEIDPARTPTPIDVELPHLFDNGVLDGRAGKVWNCVTATASQMGMPNIDSMEVEEIPVTGDGDFLYEPVLTRDYTDFAAGVNLYYHVDRMDTRFRELGYVQPVPVTVVANVHSEGTSGKTPMDNAFYTQMQNGDDGLFVGQGNNVDLAYGGDVVMHELTHAVVAHTAIHLGVEQMDQYGMNRMPMGLHEGFADFFPASLNDSPVIGAYSLEMIQPGASRDLANNNKTCPDDMVGEEHMDGELIGAFTWQVRVTLGAELAEEVVFTALTRLVATSTFKDFFETMMTTLEDFETDGEVTAGQISQIRAVAEAKGLDICGRWVPLDVQRRTLTFGLDQLGQMMGGDCAQMRQFLGMMNVELPTIFQYKVDVPEDATSLTLHLTYTPMGGTDLQYKVYGRAEQMIQYDLVPVFGGFSMPRARDFDRRWPAGILDDPLTSATSDLTWTIQDNPPLPVGQEVYFAVTYSNCPTAYLDAASTVSTDPIEDPDAGTDADIEDDVQEPEPKPKSKKDGCSCTAGTSTSPLSLGWLLLAAGLFFWIRRRVTA